MHTTRLAGCLLVALAAMPCASAQAPASSATLTSLYQFPGGGDGLLPWGGLVNVNGTLYGTAFYGGTYGRGAVFSVNPATGAESLVYSFTSGGDATYPQAPLLSNGGLLYGTSTSGGTSGLGAIYSINPATGAEKLIFSFTPATGGDSGSSLVAANGFLYGTTYGGGTGAADGTVFKVKIATGAETTLYAFTGGADGGLPQAGVSYASGMLYGTTTMYGGAGGYGTIFQVDATSGAEKTLFTFDGTDGGDSGGGVIDVGGVLYGTGFFGGTQGSGVIFAYNLASGTETTIYNFTGGADGAEPAGALIDVNGSLYGATYYGGTSGYGTVFGVNASTGAETTLYAFPGGAGGGHSLTPLIDVAGVLYGTSLGDETASSNNGTVFKIALKSKAETTLHGFQGPSPFASGHSGLLDLSGTLYGAIATGGADFAGSVYKIDPTTGAQTQVYSFTGGADGGVPVGAPVNDDGALYGIATYGGANQGGVIYTIDPATGAESVVHNFPAGEGLANGPLLLVNGLLYGTIQSAGADGGGTVFAFNPKKKTLSTIYGFTGGSDGGYPRAGLSENAGVLYGTTFSGGANYAGTVFSVDIPTGSETVLYSFTGGADGSYPSAAPLYLNGTLYGTSEYGGAQNVNCLGLGCGVLYAIALGNDTYSTLRVFSYASDGGFPEAPLVAVKGKIYGSAGTGGASTSGTIFSYAPSSKKFDVIYNFTGGADGAAPGTAMVNIGSTLYGTTNSGDTYNAGTIFSLVP